MKYINKEQIKNYLLKSSFIIIDFKTNNVNFAGLELDRCFLKLDKELIYNIIDICKMLEINHYIIN